MAYEFSLDDVAYLRSAEGQRAVAELAERPLTTASRMSDVATARSLAGERAGAALETAVLRHRATDKLDEPRDWLFTDPALQQATPSPVARHRARRLAGRDVHDVTCSIGADLAELAGTARTCVGSDLDSVRLAMAEHNVGTFTTGAPTVLVRADALRPVTTCSTIVADPGRRDSGGRRRWNPAELQPPLDELLDTYASRDMVVKAAPGMDFGAVPETAEIEIVSWRGQAREATVWSGGLLDGAVRRRATVLAPKGRSGAAADWSVTDADPDECAVAEVAEWIVEPDPAVVRAGLVRQFATRENLAQLDPRIAFLTGAVPPSGMRVFRVLNYGRYREKALRRMLRQYDVGRLEILVRGVDVDPDALRRRMKPNGAADATVVLSRVGATAMAYLCRAEWT